MSTTRKSISSPKTGKRGKSEKGRRVDKAPKNQEDGKIEVINRQRLRVINKDRAARLSRAVLDQIGRPEAILTILFIRDRAMRHLNNDYRGIDRATDVLSFAYHEDAGPWVGDETYHIGDLVISVETAERYAREQGLSFEREIEYLVIHGALHLAGYDHETDNGEMNRLERKLRKALLK